MFQNLWAKLELIPYNSEAKCQKNINYLTGGKKKKKRERERKFRWMSFFLIYLFTILLNIFI